MNSLKHSSRIGVPGRDQVLSLYGERHVDVNQGVRVNVRIGSLSSKGHKPVKGSFHAV